MKEGATQRTKAEQLELLRRYRPALVYDRQEPYRAMSVRSMVDNPGNLLTLQDGTVIARQPGVGEAELRLELLERYPGEMKAAPGDRLDAAADELAAAQRFQAMPEYADRVFGRVADDDGRVWLQYWCWYYYNPKNLLGYGKHEGDWEMVQVGLGADLRPEVVTVSQHESGEACTWSETSRHSSPDGEHPLVYVAPLSHAGYFESGSHPYPGGIDNPDGGAEPVLCEAELLGPWANWPGRWGASEGVLAPWSKGKLGGRSPASPADQGLRWDRPAAYHAQAVRATPFRKLGKLVRELGKLNYPKVKTLRATLDGQLLIVDWSLDGGIRRVATQLLVTVHDADDPSKIVVSSAVALNRRRKGTEHLVLPRPADTVLVRASAFNALRQRSDPEQVVATSTTPA